MGSNYCQFCLRAGTTSASDLRPRAVTGSTRPQRYKARIMMAAHTYNVRTRQQGQHWWPVTRSFFGVLRALLYCFQNDGDGRCFARV